MASIKWACALTIIAATGSNLVGCGSKEDEEPPCQPGTSFTCFCPPDDKIGLLTCQPTGVFSACDCSGAATAAASDTTAITGTAGTEVTADQPAEAAGAAAATGTGGKSAAATKKKSCPDGFTCSLDALLGKAYVCNPPDPAALICATKDDCTAMGLADANCVQGPGFSACTKMCEP